MYTRDLRLIVVVINLQSCLEQHFYSYLWLYYMPLNSYMHLMSTVICAVIILVSPIFLQLFMALFYAIDTTMLLYQI